MPRKKRTSKRRVSETDKLWEELRKEDKILHAGLEYTKKHLDKLWEFALDTNERLQSVEVEISLLTRFLTSICLEKMNMDLRTFKKYIKRAEKEALDDSQVVHLEQMFNLQHKDGGSNRKSKNTKRKRRNSNHNNS